MSAPTLHELNQHLFAALLPATHGQAEPEQKPKRRKADQAADAEQATEQAGDQPQE